MSGIGALGGPNAIGGSSLEHVTALLKVLSDPAAVKQQLVDLTEATKAHDEAAAKADKVAKKIVAERTAHEQAVAEHTASMKEFISAKAKDERALVVRESACSAKEQELANAIAALEHDRQEFEQTYPAKVAELEERERKIAAGEKKLAEELAAATRAREEFEARNARIRAAAS